MASFEIRDRNSGRLLARHITAEEWEKPGLHFYSGDGDFLQVGTWSYDAGKRLPGHAHNEVPRSIVRTHETLYVRRGRIEARIFNDERELVATREVSQGDLLTLMDGGHGYSILDDGTQVLEIKNGPYHGAELDRVRFEA
jgi:quercetin dioxygenase-like cupin family protein